MKNVSPFLLFPFTLILLLFTSCASKGPKTYDPRQVAFQAEYNPLYDGQLYPSLILGLNQSVNSELRTPNSELFNIELTSPTDNAVLRVVIDSSALNYVTIIQEILPRRGETYRFQPSVKWKYDILRALRTPGAVDLTFTCYINDEEVDIKNLHLAYRSVSECPLSLVSQGRTSDFRWLFAAYVNEDHPQIEQILTDIMQQGTVTRLTGYQTGGAQAVRNQVFAVWYYALDHGITYSSITCTSNPSPRANVQHICFLDEVLASRQANCVDACVFFASILRKMGLKPVIFVEPCHAYLGYYTDKKQKNIALLETTVTSWVNYPDLLRNLDPEGYLPEEQLQKIAKYLTPKQLQDYADRRISTEQLLVLVSTSLFDKASTYNQETYRNNRQHFADPDAITFQQLDIETLRQTVQPIN